MNRKAKQFRIVLVMVAVVFLWCHSVQAMPMDSEMAGMDCGQTQICGLCGFLVETDSPNLISGDSISSFASTLQPLSKDPNPERLYHPPR